ncbi:DUF3021 family protein [Ligilactobacillus equi]
MKFVSNMIQSMIIGMGFSCTACLVCFSLYGLTLRPAHMFFALSFGIFCGIISSSLEFRSYYILVPVHYILILVAFVLFCRLFKMNFEFNWFVFVVMYTIIYLICWGILYSYDWLEVRKVNHRLSQMKNDNSNKH